MGMADGFGLLTSYFMGNKLNNLSTIGHCNS